MLLTLHDHGHGHSHAAPKETSPLTALSHNHESVHANGTKLDHEKHSHQHGHGGEHVHQVSPKLEQESKRQNITVRAALIHVIGDLVQSVGVMIAAMIIYFRSVGRDTQVTPFSSSSSSTTTNGLPVFSPNCREEECPSE
ncbi:hypothetical protein X801_01594 [Opisthorchis viverrini]|uniref:Cation efflux family protein n=1 Tax=Opisthorchis viverrini TaxID=6198 RepID=A0A1S8X729_OPIVI|nr:hypothetical protein X801_01594 [Opisthorchis viverrini]